MTDHPGYDKHERAGEVTNARNGSRTIKVLTDIGSVPIKVPRDRDGSFTPRIVRKHQHRLTGVDEMVLSLSARDLTHGDISAHLAEVYGADVSKTTTTAMTDRVIEGMLKWQNRPLDPGWLGHEPANLCCPCRHSRRYPRHFRLTGVLGMPYMFK
ncbi:hypothetical protein D4765_10310 [Subtercola vilae]|uniref:Mutator family transposase n=1 Tax=Subtercola vilae TaxID=2056433 RepID=A0A4T2BW83_9MICO|nr:hypothetical protein D4765_10310 [Subtercola vilae]